MKTLFKTICICFVAVFIGSLCTHFLTKNISSVEIKSSSQYTTCNYGNHTVSPAGKDFYEDAFNHAQKLDQKDFGLKSSDVKGILVNHHLLAGQLIAHATQTIATDDEETIILISPNHFDAGNHQIILSSFNFETPYGESVNDCELAQKISSSTSSTSVNLANYANIEEDPFIKEHGIFGIIPFFKKVAPNARVLPVIVKTNTTEEQLNQFTQILTDELKKEGKKYVVVGSFDFSHELTPELADFHDIKSLQALTSFDISLAGQLDIDSQKGLQLVMKLLQQEDATTFNLLDHSNSAQQLQKFDLLDTTSYITGYFTDTKNKTNSQAQKSDKKDFPLTILAFGDMMLDRGVHDLMVKNGNMYPFTDIERIFLGNGLVVENLEGVFSNFSSLALKNHNILRFSFNPNIAAFIKKLGIDIVSQANNHASDYGKEGEEQSRKYLKENNIEYFGSFDNADAGPVYKKFPTADNTATTTVAFIGYHEFSHENDDVVLNAIATAKREGAFTIVYPHWGTEYENSFTPSQQTKAHKFIDAGADVILGSHPHVIEPIEIYKGKAIFYSMGNFVFDQDFSKETTRGLSIGLEIGTSTVAYNLFPFNIIKSKLSLMTGYQKQKLFEDVSNLSVAGAETKDAIKKGRFIIEK